MIDALKYFNIIPYDIMQFLLTFFYTMIRDIMFQVYCSVLILTSSFTLATNSTGKWSETSGFIIADFT